MATKVNASNIQGDILGRGLPKKAQTFVFFQITDGKKFVQDLKRLVPMIKVVEQVLKDRHDISLYKKEGKKGLIEMVGVNISFTYTGLRAIGVTNRKMIGTSLSADGGVFRRGAIEDAVSLGDPIKNFKPQWDPEFLEQIDGVLLVAGDSEGTTAPKVEEVIKIFNHDEEGSSIRIIRTISGVARPGKESDHEHFGFRDGISNPSVIGFDPVLPGPAQVDAKSILTGYTKAKPDWTADGSFLVFRYLLQKVPELDSFLRENALKEDGDGNSLSVEEGSELLGARLVGRWKSGAPVDVTPFKDDPELAEDPNRNNDFSYENELHDMYKCPWAAHIRRTNPRKDTPSFNLRPIARRGIAFGPEVTEGERASGVTEHERGLLFVCYQSNIGAAFRFIQQIWANNPFFPITGQPLPVPGLDPIIGQGLVRNMTGYNPATANDVLQKPLSFPDFVVPRGGVYFWTPSIKVLNELDTLVADT